MQPWNFSSATVTLKDNSTVQGTATLHFDSASKPTIVQVNANGSFITIPWSEVHTIAS